MLEGHTDNVSNLVRLDDNRLASGSSDETVRIWDVSKEALIATSSRHSQHVTDLCATRLGVISSSYDDRVLCWEIFGEAPPHTLIAGNAGWTRAMVSLDENHVASGSISNMLRIWKLSPPSTVAELSVYIREFPIGRLDNDRFIVMVVREAIAVRDSHDATWLTQLDVDSYASVVTVGQKHVAIARDDGSLLLWNPQTGEQVRYDKEPFFRAQITDDRHVVFLRRDYKLCCWDWISNETFDLCPELDSDFFITNRHMVAWKSGGMFSVFNLHTRSRVIDLQNLKTNQLQWLGLDHLIAVSGHCLQVWSLKTGECEATSFVDGEIKTISVVPEVGIIAVGDATGSVQILLFERL
jgi:WD40 repeat protein